MKNPSSETGHLVAIVAIVALVVIFGIIVVAKDTQFQNPNTLVLLVGAIVTALIGLFKGASALNALAKCFKQFLGKDGE